MISPISVFQIFSGSMSKRLCYFHHSLTPKLYPKHLRLFNKSTSCHSSKMIYFLNHHRFWFSREKDLGFPDSSNLKRFLTHIFLNFWNLLVYCWEKLGCWSWFSKFDCSLNYAFQVQYYCTILVYHIVEFVFRYHFMFILPGIINWTSQN